jgi:oligopeptide transport system substrate-binding protein
MSLQRIGLVGRLLALLLLACLLLWAWRGWDSSSTETTLRRSAGPLTETVDPQLVISNNDGVITNDLFEGLVAAAPGGKIVPAVAQRWETSADGKTWRFYLDPAARWSNGDPVTAADFVFAWRRLVDPATGAPYASFLDAVEQASAIIAGQQAPSALGVQAVQSDVLEVRLTQPTPFFLEQLRHYATFPVHGATLRRFGARWTRPGTLIGNGAYRLDQWTPGGELTLRRNPHYRVPANPSAPGFARVVYIPLEDPAIELMMWQSGALDITWELQPSMLPTLRARHATALHVDPLLGTFFWALNLQRPGLSDVRVRQALAMAVDRDSLVRDITRSGELPATRWIPPATPGVADLAPEWAAWPIRQRQEAAKALLAQAGFGPGKALTLDLVYDAGSVHREVAVACADMWAAVGVVTKLINVERRVLSSLRTDRRFDVLRAGWTGDYADAHTFLEIWHSGAGGLNQSRYRSERFDALLAASRAETDPVKRKQALREAEAQLLQDMPMIPLYFLARRGLVRDTVCGWAHDPVLDPASRWLWPAAADGCTTSK